MFSGASLENMFSVEAYATTCYLIKSSTLALVDNIPIDVLTGSNTSLKHAHVFGSKAYGFIPKKRCILWMTMH